MPGKSASERVGRDHATDQALLMSAADCLNLLLQCTQEVLRGREVGPKVASAAVHSLASCRVALLLPILLLSIRVAGLLAIASVTGVLLGVRVGLSRRRYDAVGGGRVGGLLRSGSIPVVALLSVRRGRAGRRRRSLTTPARRSLAMSKKK